MAVTTDKKHLKHYDVEDKIVLFKKFDEKKVVYEGELDKQQIRDSLQKLSSNCDRI